MGIDVLADPGVMARLLLESPCMTMRYGLESLRPRIGSIERVILTGGALKSKGGFASQMFADILGVPIVGRRGDEEGTAKGAAILAAYMCRNQSANTHASLSDFAKDQTVGEEETWEPSAERVGIYNERFARFSEYVGRW